MDNKLDTITNLFEGKEIRSVWDSEKEEYFFQVLSCAYSGFLLSANCLCGAVFF